MLLFILFTVINAIQLRGITDSSLVMIHYDQNITVTPYQNIKLGTFIAADFNGTTMPILSQRNKTFVVNVANKYGNIGIYQFVTSNHTLSNIQLYGHIYVINVFKNHMYLSIVNVVTQTIKNIYDFGEHLIPISSMINNHIYYLTYQQNDIYVLCQVNLKTNQYTKLNVFKSPLYNLMMYKGSILGFVESVLVIVKNDINPLIVYEFTTMITSVIVDDKMYSIMSHVNPPSTNFIMTDLNVNQYTFVPIHVVINQLWVNSYNNYKT